MANFYRDQDLLANQFCDSADFKIWLSEKMRAYDNAGDWLQYVQDNMDIYTAEGYWLDLFGLVIGQGRTIPDAILVEFFGFVSTPAALGFGEARFWDGVEPLAGSSVLADPEYRTVLLAKIAFNFADVTLTGIAESLSVIFNTVSINVRPIGIANCDLYIGVNLTTTQKQLVNALDLLPRAAGVSFDRKTSGLPSEIFGFRNTPYDYATFGVGRFAEVF
tara:strand:+ start:675 stop:1331 length:657 start_codon:yes stop_codon:yes gene_type:complete